MSSGVYCEMIRNNHQYGEPSTQFISLLSNDCIQLDSWPPQLRALAVYPSHGYSLPQQKSIFQT